MTLTNHLSTGAVIAKLLPLPIAIPLAFASHFVIDSLPHFGFQELETTQQHWKLWKQVTFIDISIAIIFSIWLIAERHFTWLLVGFVAYSPDIVWVYRFILKEKFNKDQSLAKNNRLTEFHSSIQKYERVWGGFIELAYAAIMLLIVS